MRKKGIKRDNEIFKCTLIANLSLRMSKLEREKKTEREWQKDREKKGVMREERGKNKREERGQRRGEGQFGYTPGRLSARRRPVRVLCTRRLLTSG